MPLDLGVDLVLGNRAPLLIGDPRVIDVEDLDILPESSERRVIAGVVEEDLVRRVPRQDHVPGAVLGQAVAEGGSQLVDTGEEFPGPADRKIEEEERGG